MFCFSWAHVVRVSSLVKPKHHGDNQEAHSEQTDHLPLELSALEDFICFGRFGQLCKIWSDLEDLVRFGGFHLLWKIWSDLKPQSLVYSPQ